MQSTTASSTERTRLSSLARRAAQARDWSRVRACAERLLARDTADAEGRFLLGLAEKAAGRPLEAAAAFEAALAADAARYDAAIELANQRAVAGRNAEAAALLARYEDYLGNSPRYLDMAGTVYVHIGLPAQAWPLYVRAVRLQPEIDLFQANLAACSVYLGYIEEAKRIYAELLERNPAHRRNHYQLSRLGKARDDKHVEQMKTLLRRSGEPPEREIFLYYAIAKELEDLERWDEAFEYYKRAGDTVASVADYDVGADVELIDTIIDVCSAEWLAAGPEPPAREPTPIFIVGLPRTGTTLVERIVSSHSSVESVGETLFVPAAIRRASGVDAAPAMTPAVIEAAAAVSPLRIAEAYLEALAYRLTGKPMLVEKFPENFLYLGFIARAFPDARIVHMRRNPMDTCFALYKQSFFRYAYTFDDLARYYAAHERLARHWRAVLGERLVELDYEALVSAPEAETRALLERLGLGFEPACLEIERNPAPSATASAAQVREPIHTRSLGRWKRFEAQLQPLAEALARSGIAY